MKNICLFLSLLASLFGNDYRVLGIGTACVDLITPVEAEFLLNNVSGEKGGACPCSPEEMNRILNAISTPPLIVPGGSCANTIRGLAQLGETCAYQSTIGNDPFGELFSQNLEQLGIVSLLKLQIDDPTFRILCMITPDGERTLRASGKCPHDQLLPAKYFQNIALAHFEGFQLLAPNTLELSMQQAKEAGALISFDLSSFETVRGHKEEMLHLLTHYVDIVFANEDEARALTDLPPEEACMKLQSICPIAIVKRGDKGCLVGAEGKILISPAFLPTTVVDSTGAGDLFASGFLYGILHHYTLETCAEIANRLGSAIIEVQGALLPEEKWVAIHEFLIPFSKE